MTVETEARDDRPVSQAVQPCPLRFWFDLRLRFKPESQPRPRWWPVERLPGAPGAAVNLALAGAAPLQQLDADGHLRLEPVPAGSGNVLFYDYLSGIQQAIDEGVVFHAR
jgi:hypothetical protein